MFYLYSFQSIQFFEEHMPNMFVVSNAYAYFGTWDDLTVLYTAIWPLFPRPRSFDRQAVLTA